MSQNINSTQIFYGLAMKMPNIKMPENRSEKIPYVQVRQKNAGKLKISLKTLLLSYIVYTSAEAY